MQLPVDVPFYHRRSHGLYAGADRLWWVTLRRAGESASLVSVDSVPRAETSLDEALRALMEQRGGDVGAADAVATHLDPSRVRFATGNVDATRDATDALRRIVRRELPASVSPDDFVIRYQQIDGNATGTGRAGRDDDAPVAVVVVMARADAVASRREWLKEHDVSPVLVGDVRTDVGFAFSFTDAFVRADVPVLLAGREKGWLVRHRRGVLSAPPEPLSTGLAGVVEEAVLRLVDDDASTSSSDAPPPLWVVGEGTEEALNAHTDASSPRPARRGRPHLDGIAVDDTPRDVAPREDTPNGDPGQGDLSADVPAGAVPAVALAVQALFPDAGSINVLPDEDVETLREEHDRADATQAVLGLGLVLAVLLAAVTLADVVFQSWVQQTEAELASLRERLVQVDQARATRNALRERLQQSQQLLVNRARVAPLLEDVGRAVPDGVWLSGIEIAKPRTQQTVITIAGYALREREVADFLSRLERAQTLTGVRLQVSERLSETDVYRRTDTFRRALTRFEIRLERAT